jgi:hypothetical protein
VDGAADTLIDLKQRNLGNANAGVDFGATDFAAVARAFGIHGEWADDRESLETALSEALARKEASLIACRIGARTYDGRILGSSTMLCCMALSFSRSDFFAHPSGSERFWYIKSSNMGHASWLSWYLPSTRNLSGSGRQAIHRHQVRRCPRLRAGQELASKAFG